MFNNQTTPIRKVAISTGGGDAPGLNAQKRNSTLHDVSRCMGWINLQNQLFTTHSLL